MKLRILIVFSLTLALLILVSIEIKPVIAQVNGTTERVSIASDGTEGNGGVGFSSISADGRYVAFSSYANNLVGGDTNDFGDIFVHDRQTGQTTRVSVASDGTQGNNNSQEVTQGIGPSISGDGRYVAFRSLASNLVLGDTNGWPDIFVHDRQTGQTTRVSVASDGTQGDSLANAPSISGDGRYVAFHSVARTLVSGDTNNNVDIFVHDRLTGETTRVSVASDGTPGNHTSWDASISADGRYVAFSSYATNFVSGDTNNTYDVFVHDRLTGQTTRVSNAPDGTAGNSMSGRPRITFDGRYVAFNSNAYTLVDGDTNGFFDVFVHDRLTGETTRVSVASDGTQGNSSSAYLSRGLTISADGRYVAFSSKASNLVLGDTNGWSDIFVHDRQTGQTTRVSVASDGTQGDFQTVWPSISSNGRFVAFTSQARNLVDDDRNYVDDVFVHDWEVAVDIVISGRVTTRSAAPLRFVTVELLSNGSIQDSTQTNEDGFYEFPDQSTPLEPGNYAIRVHLRHDYPDPNTGFPVLRIQHGNPPVPVTAETEPFTLSPGETKVVNIDFGNTPLNTDNSISAGRLDDLATIYSHSIEVIEYGRDVLNVTHDLDLPIEVFAYHNFEAPIKDKCTSTEIFGAVYYVTARDGSADIYIGEASSDLSEFDAPWNREWHELFHELMDDTGLGIPVTPDGDENHQGFINSSTAYSWIEGWAEFWATQLAQHVGLPSPQYYRWGGSWTDLEQNYRPTDLVLIAEEFAVASLLWDLVDPVDADDEDFIERSVADLWEAIGSTPLQNILDVYEALVDNHIGEGVVEPGGLTQLETLFTAHGFFIDTNGNGTFDPGVDLEEGIGHAANTSHIKVMDRCGKEVDVPPRPDRSNLPPIPKGYIKISVKDAQGQNVDEGMVEIFVEFQDFPKWNFSYSVDLALLQDGQLRLNPPPGRIPATVSLWVVTPRGEVSDTFIASNDTYWQAVAAIDLDFVSHYVFDISKTGDVTTLILIDIKPGSDPNCFNNDGHGVIPVAILSSSVFDATQVDPTTVSLDGQDVRIVGKGNTQAHIEDINGDGLNDLVVKIEDTDGVFQEGNIVARLVGETYAGLHIQGTDTVCIVP